ncbi:hypothetical protein J3Q64DRAFT_1838516 [Phycomyces blakesleeanus]|uniref:Uncharacterized protein n=1 Tax=Phycomyces blakesleeanus TaxID=4837 RepID=A0ABR3ARV0_PHYBL
MSYSSSRFDPSDYPYIIGIDFGTTYSGCSYFYTEDSTGEILEITEWPKQRGAIYPKVPTASLYEANGKRMIAWGNDAIFKAQRPNNKDVLVERFKLTLDPNIASKATLPNGLTSLEVITDYLTAFHAYVLEYLDRVLGHVYQHSKSRYCLTVPAMWDDQAKATMREAAILAGIVSRADNPDRLVLTSEPEAASLFCEKKCDQFELEEGKRFMICDAGGGTVDLIVFGIDDNNGKKTLREITKGSGASCGSTFLDARMRRIFKTRFGEYYQDNKQAINHIMKQFVTVIKPQFENEDDEFFSMPMSLKLSEDELSEIGIEDGKLQISVDDLREEVFEPVVKQVLDLISDQVNQARKKLDAVFLVGGFGQSKYLQERVKETFESKIGLIAMPARGELAVVRGAVIFGLSPGRVSHRVARRTYGLAMDSPFDYIQDPAEYKYIAADGSVMSLYVYDGNEVPPRYTTHYRVRKVSNFTIKMPFIPNAYTNQKIGATLNMYFGNTEILVEIKIHDKVFRSASEYAAHELEKISVPIDREEESENDDDDKPEYSFI